MGKEQPQLAAITAIAFAALGIIATFALITLAATIVHAAIVGHASTFYFAICCTIGYFLVRQALATVHPGVEDVQGAPPNIPLSGQVEYRTQVMKATWNCLNNRSYKSSNGTIHTLDLTQAIHGAKVLQDAGPQRSRGGDWNTSIRVSNQDSLYAAAELHAEGLNPIVLDIAHNDYFGGSYLEGASGQEEDYCRRSALPFAVHIRWGLQKKDFYPLHKHAPSGGIYVPNVPVFRAGYDKGYQYLNQPFEVGFGIFAIPNSALFNLFENPLADIRGRIRTFFEMARQNGHQSVVFGPFGCAQYKSDQIAYATMDVIKKEFAHCFKEIVIAISDDVNFKPFAHHCLKSGGRVFGAGGVELTQV